MHSEVLEHPQAHRTLSKVPTHKVRRTNTVKSVLDQEWYQALGFVTKPAPYNTILLVPLLQPPIPSTLWIHPPQSANGSDKLSGLQMHYFTPSCFPPPCLSLLSLVSILPAASIVTPHRQTPSSSHPQSFKLALTLTQNLNSSPPLHCRRRRWL